MVMTRNSIISADNVGNANTYIDQYYAGIMEMNMVSLQNDIISMTVVREGVVSAVGTAIDAVIKFIKDLIGKFVSKISEMANDENYKKFQDRKDALSKLDPTWCNNQIISMSPFFGTNLNDTDIFQVSVFDGKGAGLKDIPEGDRSFKKGWKDDAAMNKAFAPKLYSNVKLQNGVQDSLINRAKAFYTGGGGKYKFSGQNIINVLIKYCDTYKDTVRTSVTADSTRLSNRLNKLQAGASVNREAIATNALNAIDDLMILTEGLVPVNEVQLSDSSTGRSEPTIATKGDPETQDVIGDSDGRKKVKAVINNNGKATVDNNDTTTTTNPKQKNKRPAALDNEIKYVKGCVSVLSCKMTICESCYYKSLNILNKIYDKAVKEGAIVEEDNENNNEEPAVKTKTTRKKKAAAATVQTAVTR